MVKERQKYQKEFIMIYEYKQIERREVETLLPVWICNVIKSTWFIKLYELIYGDICLLHENLFCLEMDFEKGIKVNVVEMIILIHTKN